MHDETIRNAAATDAAGLAALMTALGYPTTDGEMGARLAAILPRADYATFVAEGGGGLVAMLGAAIEPRYNKNGACVRLMALVVAEESQGRGLGAALVAAAERWGAELGATEIQVTSAHHRAGAHAFYRRLGYRDTGVRLVKSIAASEPGAAGGGPR
jgi:GNAT superfamily N-acetyltransferase